MHFQPVWRGVSYQYCQFWVWFLLHLWPSCPLSQSRTRSSEHCTGWWHHWLLSHTPPIHPSYSAETQLKKDYLGLIIRYCGAIVAQLMLGSAAQAVEDVIATIRHFLLLAMKQEQLHWCPWHCTLGKINFLSTQFVSNKMEAKNKVVSVLKIKHILTFLQLICDYVTRPGGSSHSKCHHGWACVKM